MHTSRVLWIVLAIAACKSDGQAPAKPKQLLNVSIAGKPVTIAQAFVVRLPVVGRFQVYLTDGKASCRQLLDNAFSSDGDQTVLFDVGQRLAPAGTLTDEMTYLYRMGRDATIAPGSKVTVKGTPDQGTKVEVEIDADIAVQEEGAIAIHGAVTAAGCGDRAPDPSGVPKAKHRSTATLTIAGHQLPLVGARRTVERGELELSTGPLACSDSTPDAAAIVDFTRGTWGMRGKWFGLATLRNTSMSDADGQPETKALVIKPGATGTSDDGPTVQLEVAGAGSIGGYPVALAGAIEVLDCP